MTRKTTPEEKYLWRANTDDVTTYRPREKISITQKIPAASRTLVPAPPRSYEPKDLSFALTRRALKRITIDARLDLHGYTLDQAWHALKSFLSAKQGSCRTVLIITGKSRGSSGATLSSEIPRWLYEQPFCTLIQGFRTARAQDGGTGALYVFLRKRR